jgi:hypothetical protein
VSPWCYWMRRLFDLSFSKKFFVFGLNRTLTAHVELSGDSFGCLGARSFTECIELSIVLV